MEFYRALLHLQEPLHYHSAMPRWYASVAADGDGPWLLLERLPVDELADEFHRFVSDARPAMTDVLAPTARRLSGDGSLAGETLEVFLSGGPFVHLADRAECSVEELRFFPHAFLAPVAERLGATARSDRPVGSTEDESARPGIRHSCPACGQPPVVGVIRDEPDALGKRRLVCSLCSTGWSFPRLTCAGCGETDPDELAHHIAEPWSHVRIDECRTCTSYSKTVDLRTSGEAVAVVDELASLELDLWADGRGLEKLQRNLLGF